MINALNFFSELYHLVFELFSSVKSHLRSKMPVPPSTKANRGAVRFGVPATSVCSVWGATKKLINLQPKLRFHEQLTV